jgi:epoxyqueuosine reductase QueG
MNLDQQLSEYVNKEQIPLYGIASASGFEYAQPGLHPKDLMPTCQSAIVFGTSFIEYPLNVRAKHKADDSWWEHNRPVDQQIGDWRGDLVNLLDKHGLGAANFGGYKPQSEPSLSYRLAQIEAGVGVFGRFGVCLNPDLGCYYKVGVLLTDAVLTPSDKNALSDFNPCEGCHECADVCPVKGIDASKPPGAGYNRDLCVRFILKMKERHGMDTKICSRCFSVCPWGAGRFKELIEAEVVIADD